MSIYSDYLHEGFFDKKDPKRKEIMKNILNVFKNLCNENGIMDASLTTPSLLGENKKFLTNNSNIMKISVDSKANLAACMNGGSNNYMFKKTTGEVFKTISSNRNELIKSIKEVSGSSNVSLDLESAAFKGCNIIVEI